MKCFEKDYMKRKLPKVIKYSPYFKSIMINDVVYTRDRDILTTEEVIIKKFENELKNRGIKFKKKKIGKYIRYYVVF